MSDTTSLETRTVGTGADTITYDVRGSLSAATPDRPVLMMFGSPMDASGFASLAARFTDRPVVTYDPRGTGRNPTGTSPLEPEQHAEDLHRLVTALDVGPVDMLASSGGAVNALALASVHPDDVRRLVAHEPPLADLLPDRDVLLAACADIPATYAASGSGPAMGKFIALVMQDGPLPDDYLDQPAPPPAAFGPPAADEGTDPLMRNLPSCNAYRPDFEVLATLGPRLVIGAGVESGDQFAARGGRSVAARLGLSVADFPSGHGGFLGDEYGQPGDPDGFAETLRRILDAP